MEFLSGVAIGAVLLVAFLVYSNRRRGSKGLKKTPPPQAGGARPFIGHLHLMSGTAHEKLPHFRLATVAEKHGPIFTIRIGVHPALVISNWKLAKEVFVANDLAVLSRPPLIAAEHLGYNSAMFAFASYGPYWREVRKLITVELLSSKKMEMLKHIRVDEINQCSRELYQQWEKAKDSSGRVSVDLKRWLGDLNLNVQVRMVAGKRYFGKGEDKKAAKCQKILENFFFLLGTFTPADALPYLRWLDLGGFERRMKECGKEMDSLAGEWLQEHRQEHSGDRKQQDFLHMMIDLLNNNDKRQEFDADTIIKSTCLGLIAGGSDSPTVMLTWILSMLLNHRRVLKKLQEELDNVIGKHRRVEESDIPQLEYLNAVIKETFRLYPPGPLGGQRVFTEDCKIGGFHIPKGTRLIVNLWKLQRDPEVWSEPLEFKPERFLTTHKDIDVKGQDFVLTPFGSGRRSCPAINFGLLMVQLILANFLQAFDVWNAGDELVDMTESAGLINAKATPLDVLLAPRLSSDLY